MYFKHVYIYIYMYISTGQPLPQYHPLYSSTDLAKAFKSATSIPYELNFLAVFHLGASRLCSSKNGDTSYEHL